jgi:hypothetical protein
MNTKHVVSLSLFGYDNKYLIGAERLLKSVSQNLPAWQTVFFVGNSVPLSTCRALEKNGARLIVVNEPENLSATAWRFRIRELGTPERIIFRDSDSIVSRREAAAIGEWLSSGLSAHIIRDHPLHFAPIMAGLWGFKPALFPWFGAEVQDFKFLDKYGSDQDFLAQRVYPRIIDSALVHASFHRHEEKANFGEFKIGSSRLGNFCGESVTSSFLDRSYARALRLTHPKGCKCES